MNNYNQHTIIGFVGKEPNSRVTQGGNLCCTFSIATSNRRKNAQGEWEDGETSWHNIVCWRDNAEYANSFIRKGTKVIVIGKAHTRNWEKDGQTHYITEVTADIVGAIVYERKQAGQQAPPPDDLSADFNLGDLGPAISMDEELQGPLSPGN